MKVDILQDMKNVMKNKHQEEWEIVSLINSRVEEHTLNIKLTRRPFQNSLVKS